MSRRRLGGLVIAAVLVLAAALYMSASRNQQAPAPGRRLLPELGAELDAVTSVTLRKAGAEVTLHRSGDRWTVVQRGDYPADLGKLRALLTSVSDAQIIEEKTADPASFARIGVDDPAQGGGGTQLTLAVKGGTQSVIVGKPSGQGSFVRLATENRSYLVEPAITPDAEPRSWIDPRLLDVAPASIERIDVKLADGTLYALHRIDPKDSKFALDGTPPGRKPLDSSALAPASSMFGNLAAEDVAPLGDIDFGRAAQVVITLADGAALTLTGVVAGDKHWLQVTSSNDGALSAKTDGRALEVASYRYDGIFRPLEQLLVPRETAVPKPARMGRR